MATNARDEVVRFVYEITGDKDVAATAATMLKAGEAAGTTQEEFDTLSKSLTDAASKFKLINQAIGQKAALAELTTQLAEAQAGLDKLRTEFDQTDASSKKVSKSFSDAEKAVQQLAAQQNAASVALQKTEGALQKAGVDTTNLAGAFQKVKDDGNAAANSLAQVGTQTAKAQAGTKALGDEAKHSGGLIQELKDHLLEIVSAATAVELALKGIELGTDAFKEAVDVEQSLSRVRAAATGAAADFAALGDEIEKSARAANVSSSEAAAAAAALAQQGESAQEIFKTLTPTLLLARDANLEVAQSAAIVDDVLDLFGKSASDAADVVDKLVVASKGSKEGLAGMADAIRTLAPDARALGLDFDHLLGLLGNLTVNGIDASKAVRGLRTVFQDLQNPTSAFALALHDLGDSSSDFGTAIETLRKAGPGGERALLSLDGAARSLVLFLIQQGPGAVDAFTASLQRAQGAAAETRKALDDNLGGAFTALEHSLDSLGKGLADSTLKPLRDELQSLSERLNAFAASPAFETLKKSLTDLFVQGTAAFENFVNEVDWPAFIKSIQDGIQDASKTIASFKDDVGKVADAINAVGAVVGIFTRSIAVAFDGLQISVSGTIFILSGIAAKMSAINDKVQGFSDGTTEALEAIRDSAEHVAENGVDALDKNLTKLGQNLVSVGGASETTAAQVDKLTESASKTAASVTEASAGAAQTTDDFNAVSGAVDNMATALGILTPALNLEAEAQRAAKTEATLHAEQIVVLQKEVTAAKEKLEELAKSGTASAAEMQKAANDYTAAQKSLEQLSGSAKSAADAQTALKQAFTELGIVSQKSLDEAAGHAKDNLEAIRQAFLAGNATIEDVKRAYDSYAQKVRASVADSTDAIKQQKEAQLDALATALGFVDAAGKAGAAGAQAGSDTAAGFDKAKSSIDDAAGAADNLATSATAAATGIDELGAGAAVAGANVGGLASGLQGVTLLTNEQLRLLREVRDEYLSGAIGAEEYAQRATAALTGVDLALQQQEEQLRQFNDRLNDLQSQLASANGDDVAVENLRHAKKMQDLKDEQDLSTAQRAQLERLEEQLHEANLRRIKAENDARAGGTGTNTQGGGSGTSPGPNGPSPAPTPQRGQPIPGLTIDFSGATIIGGTKDQIAEQLARLVLKPLQEIAARSV